MMDLYTVFPEGSKIKYLVFQKKDSLNLQGNAFTDPDVDNVINILRESPFFDRRGIEWKKSSDVRIYKEKLKEFHVDCTLRSNPVYNKKDRTGKSRKSRGRK